MNPIYELKQIHKLYSKWRHSINFTPKHKNTSLFRCIKKINSKCEMNSIINHKHFLWQGGWWLSARRSRAKALVYISYYIYRRFHQKFSRPFTAAHFYPTSPHFWWVFQKKISRANELNIPYFLIFYYNTGPNFWYFHL